MGFLLSFLAPGFVILSVWLGPRIGYPNALLWLPFVMAYVVVPSVDVVWARLPVRGAGASSSPVWSAYFRVLPLLSVLAQLAMLAAASSAFVSSPLSWATLLR